MNRTEQAYIDYIKKHILPILEGYIGQPTNPETIKKMEHEIFAILESHLIQHGWRLEVAE